jgi:hypothetical protein
MMKWQKLLLYVCPVEMESVGEKQDDEVAEVASELRKMSAVDQFKHLLVLTDKTFYETTSDRRSGPLLVLFYVKCKLSEYCHLCRLFS